MKLQTSKQPSSLKNKRLSFFQTRPSKTKSNVGLFIVAMVLSRSLTLLLRSPKILSSSSTAITTLLTYVDAQLSRHCCYETHSTATPTDQTNSKASLHSAPFLFLQILHHLIYFNTWTIVQFHTTIYHTTTHVFPNYVGNNLVSRHHLKRRSLMENTWKGVDYFIKYIQDNFITWITWWKPELFNLNNTLVRNNWSS
jgi:hypothetical protein